MTTEQKSSDEILTELFSLCAKTTNSSDESSQHDESEEGEVESTSRSKRKKKKKKHKKTKKRHRSASADSEHFVEYKSHKRKKKKSHKSSDEDNSKKLKIKIKKEPLDDTPFNDLDIEKNSDNLMDITTGQKLTIDDVFNSLGILTESDIKTEKKFAAVKIKKENGCEEKGAECNITASGTNEVEPSEIKVEKDIAKRDSKQDENLNAVFEATDNDNEADKDKSKSKKISIQNLKNSYVYEATIKEVEELERQKAEKYEEGELSTSSSSENELTGKSAGEEENETSSQKEKCRRKHKHRSKSHESSKSKHFRRHRKRSHSKHSHHKSHRSSRESSSPHHGRSSKPYYDYHHHHPTHRRSHYYYYPRASSIESGTSFKFEKTHMSRSLKREKSKDESHSRTRSKGTSRERRSRSNSAEKIDKQKLLEIARKNAITLLKQGALPASVIVNKDKLTSIKAGGKTVDELTDFCKQLSKKDAEGQESVSSGSDLESNEDRAFHHPFQLKERPSSIVMNIRNAVSLPTKTAQEKTLQLSKQLSLQYPVSSGQQHRTTESEWIPVEKTVDPIPPPPPPSIPLPVPSVPISVPGSEPFYANSSVINPPAITYPTVNCSNGYGNAVVPAQSNVDIGSIVAQRLEAIRRLTENPADPIGNNLIQVADTKMKVWAESKVQPGLFTGSTGVKPLSVAELSSGFKAWPKKNQFTAAKPVISDKGEALMKKMGWQPGEGLGKYKQGPPEPCEISMKTDRKGLAEQTSGFQQNNTVKRAFELSQNKHPVSLLNEYCSRKKIGVPQYDCEEKEGAGKRKLFLFSVTVQGVKYTPKMPCCNKKQSKIEAATLCLQNLGLLPVTNPTA